MEARGGDYSRWCITKSITAMYGNYTSAGPASTQVYGTQFNGSSGPSAVVSPAVESVMFTVPPPPPCPARHDSCTSCISCTSCSRGTHHYHHSTTPTLASVSPTCTSSNQSEEDRTLALQLRAAAIFNKTDVAVSGGGLGGTPTSLSLPHPSSANFSYPPPSHLTPFTHPVQSCDTSPAQYCTCNASPNSNCSNSSSPLPSCPYHSFSLTSATTTTSAAVPTTFYPNTIMTSLSNTDYTSNTAPATTTSTTAYLDSPSPSGQSCSGPALLLSHPPLPTRLVYLTLVFILNNSFGGSTGLTQTIAIPLP